MHKLTRSSIAAALITTWAFSAAAQQQPGTNVPTPAPGSEPAASVATTTALEEPVIDAKTHSSSLPNSSLLVTGLVVLGASYGASVAGAAISDRESNDKLYYPVVGPWMALNDRDCAAEPCGQKTLNTTLLVGSGVLQGLGALSMIMSLMIPSKTTNNWYLIGNDELNVTPLGGISGMGATASGHF